MQGTGNTVAELQIGDSVPLKSPESSVTYSPTSGSLGKRYRTKMWVVLRKRLFIGLFPQ